MQCYFAVIATKGEETQRLIAKLDYLTHPGFLTLLDQAKEAYGFGQMGALKVPSCPQDFQQILDDGKMDTKLIRTIMKRATLPAS